MSEEPLSLTNEAKTATNATRPYSYPIDARSINSLLHEIGRTTKIDYLNIDIEGGEIAALRGCNFGQWAPKIVTVEIHESSIERGLVHPAARFLIECGYVCVACAVITYFFVHGDAL